MLRTAQITLVFLCYIATSEFKTTDTGHEVRKFPDGFLFGTATGAYQTEGAWNIDGKGQSMWDNMTHLRPCKIKNCETGDEANDSYHKYKRDVEMMRELGLDFHRFSLSWTRILPTSFPDKINQAGVDYYNNFINEMLKYNIEPLVTIYHWDLPQALQNMGGWTNPYIIDWFFDYARTVFELFGDRVKYWITINEPREVCYQGYAGKTMAPFINISGYAEYICAKNLLIAHAKAYHLYNNEYKEKYGGIIGIAISGTWYEPEREEDIQAAEDTSLFEWGQYVYPIFSETGDFPPVVKERVAAKSAKQGFYRSRFPDFTPEEVKLVRGTSDFFGLNSYTSNVVYRNESVYGSHVSPSYYDDLDVALYQPSGWETTASSWLKIVPWGFYKLLTKIRNEYNNPLIIVAENGMSTTGGLEDDVRIRYYRMYLNAMLDAIDEGSNIRMYAAWSLTDNFEWMAGFSEKFGLYQVDHKSPERTRTPRKSAFVYKEIIRSRALDMNFEPDTRIMTIDEGH